MDFLSESVSPEALFKDLTFEEAKERYGIFLQTQLRHFSSLQNECSVCHTKGKMKACYINNKPKAVCEQCRLKQQSKALEEYKKQNPNNNLIIVNKPWNK